MALLEEMLNELHDKSKSRIEMKLHAFCNMKQIEKEEKLNQLRRKSERGEYLHLPRTSRCVDIINIIILFFQK